MATDLGKVAIVAKGTWSSSATYEVLDAVSYNNGLYLAKQDVPANTAPTNTTYWQAAITDSYNYVSCNDITDLYDLVALITTTQLVGRGDIGDSNSNGLKTKIGNPFSGKNYISVFIRLIGKRNDSVFFECCAGNEQDEYYSMAHKYIWFNGTSHREHQSAWETIARQV